jgi:hypothetical protein
MKIRNVLLLTALLALAPRTTLAHGGTEVTVNGDVRPGALIEVEGEEFEAGDDVRIELLREGTEPVELGSVRTDEEGGFLASLHVPVSVEAGLYRLEAVGVESASVEVTILEPLGDGEETSDEEGSVSSDRPAKETVGLGLAVVLAAAIGAGLVWVSSRRTRGPGGQAGAFGAPDGG